MHRPLTSCSPSAEAVCWGAWPLLPLTAFLEPEVSVECWVRTSVPAHLKGCCCWVYKGTTSPQTPCTPHFASVTARVWCRGGIDRKKNSTINLITAYGECFYCLHINLSSHTGRHNKQIFLQCSRERQNIFEKLQLLYHPAPHTPNRNIHPHV